MYYVSNRVRSIDDAVRRVTAAAGEARVGVAHGQMGKEELERVMEDFSAGELDVLVATTIIESGIDNPHTNTLIIEDSQRLGLAQMYQLKGRVGRSSTQAYAYFMFPEQREPDRGGRGPPDRHWASIRIWAAACASPCATWRYAARAAFWAPSSRATCRPWASTCSPRCWHKP